MNRTISDTDHNKRVRQELVDAGVTRYGLMKPTIRDIPTLVNQDEHVGGVIYGLNSNGSATILATNSRVVYMDHKPFFKRNDELSYDIVGGVSHNVQGRFAAVVLHTRAGDFSLRYVNKKAAGRFVKFIESRQIKQKQVTSQEPISLPSFLVHKGQDPVHLSRQSKIFLATHEVGVLSTLDVNQRLYGATVYYVADKNNYLYIVSKSKTTKISNISKNPQAAFTIYDYSSMHTLQLSGRAHIENDSAIKEKIFKSILRPRFDGKHAEMPPIMYMPSGDYVVICFVPERYKFSDYKTQQ